MPLREKMKQSKRMSVQDSRTYCGGDFYASEAALVLVEQLLSDLFSGNQAVPEEILHQTKKAGLMLFDVLKRLPVFFDLVLRQSEMIGYPAVLKPLENTIMAWLNEVERDQSVLQLSARSDEEAWVPIPESEERK